MFGTGKKISCLESPAYTEHKYRINAEICADH
jgi:hypothetical protein